MSPDPHRSPDDSPSGSSGQSDPDRTTDREGIRIRDRDSLASSPARETALACVEAGVEAVLPGRVVPRTVALDGDRLRIDPAGSAGPADRPAPADGPDRPAPAATDPTDPGQERRERGEGEDDEAGEEDEAGDDGRDAGDAAAVHDLGEYDEVILIGGGKAAARVARALEGVLGDGLDGGVVVTDAPVETDRVAVHEAAHPVPDERGIAGAERVLDRARAAGEDTLALVTITGGASALLPAPAPGLSLSDLRAVTGALLSAGAPIAETNAVRKHCSRIKGGLLARALAPATTVTLAMSDVVGDDPAVIGSGPTVPDPTTYADAVDALERYGVEAPPAVDEHLRAGRDGDRPETPEPGDPDLAGTAYHRLAGNRTALAAAGRTARDRGYRTLVLSSRVRGEAREAARTHAALAEELVAEGDPLEPPAVVLSGGETTVTATGEGRGGPSAEFALSAAVEFATRGGGVDVGRRVALAAVDTDGRDGPAAGAPAGAVVDGRTVGDPREARGALAANDAHGSLDGRGAIHTGATGTNVNDLRVIVVEPADGEDD